MQPAGTGNTQPVLKVLSEKKSFSFPFVQEMLSLLGNVRLDLPPLPSFNNMTMHIKRSFELKIRIAL